MRKLEAGDEIIITGFKGRDYSKHAKKIRKLFTGEIYIVIEIGYLFGEPDNLLLRFNVDKKRYKVLKRAGFNPPPVGSDYMLWFSNIEFECPKYDMSKVNSLCRR